MWSSEDFPGARNVAWPYLIRARYQLELDAAIASIITRAVLQVAPREFGQLVARAAVEAIGFDGASEEAPPGNRLNLLTQLAEWDGELCPRPPRWPHFDELDEIGDAFQVVVLQRAAELLRIAGSDQLQKVLGGALERGGFEQQAA